MALSGQLNGYQLFNSHVIQERVIPSLRRADLEGPILPKAAL